MKIYAVADIHGNEKYIRRIYDVIDQEHPDILIIAGDITHYFDSNTAFEQLNDISIPAYVIRGNWDFKGVEKIITARKNMKLITPNPTFESGFPILGFNGTLFLPFLSKVCLMEKRLLATAAPQITPETILVAHPPPRGILDQVGQKFNAGSFGLRRLIEAHPPKMLLCGHIHETSGYEVYKDTLVVNCAMNKTCSGAIIDCDKNNQPVVKMIMNHSKV